MNRRAALLMLAERREPYIPAPADEPLFQGLLGTRHACWIVQGHIEGYGIGPKAWEEDLSPHHQQDVRS